MASVQEELGLEDLPAWAQPFFDKVMIVSFLPKVLFDFFLRFY